MLERDLGSGEEIWSADGGLNKSLVNTSTIERLNMTLEEYEQQQKNERDIRILSRLIGTTICRRREEWDTTRQLYATFYETMKIQRAVLEISPVRHVKIEFDSSTSPAIFSTLDDFDSLIGKVEQYGSIKEMLVSEGFSFGKL